MANERTTCETKEGFQKVVIVPSYQKYPFFVVQRGFTTAENLQDQTTKRLLNTEGKEHFKLSGREPTSFFIKLCSFTENEHVSFKNV